jgi:Family of unknown function (DUF6524)
VAKKSNKHHRRFTFTSFLLRFVFALVLVLLTYNPTDYSYSHWLRSAVGSGTFGPEHTVFGVALLGGWLVFVRATFLSLGALGLLVCSAFMAALVWWLIDLGWLSASSFTAMEWVTLTCLSVLLAIGVSWSHLRRRLTGQYDVEDVDD